eukprot:5703840-Ditylum_brightwellii.AAC.1
MTEIMRLQAEATCTAAEESCQSREEKDPSYNEFPCLGNKTTENFTVRYNSILSKLSTAAWIDLYDNATNDVIAQNTQETKSFGNHFYPSLCGCLYGEELNMMDSKITYYQ